MKKIILVLVVVLSLVSCKQEQTPVGNNFLFVKTQPINESELSKIPNKFLGNYTNSDSTKLSFTENAIFKETTDKFRFHKRDLDSLKKDFDVIKGNGPCNAKRLKARVDADKEGAWVREAAAAYAMKQSKEKQVA